MVHRDIDIESFTLSEFVPFKLAAPTLEVAYDVKATVFLAEDYAHHAQQRCKNLAFPFARSNVIEVPIKRTEVVAKEQLGTKGIMGVTLDTTHIPNIYYQPGDTIGVLPRNSASEVESILAAMELLDKANKACTLKLHPTNAKKTAKLPPHIPAHTTPYEILRDCLNIRAVPKKQLLRALAESCANKLEQNFLLSLSSKEGSKHYNELILEGGLTLLDLLILCPSCQPTLELLSEHLPRLLPRPYSIANSPDAHGHEIQFYFSILPDRPGVTTGMLQSMGTVLEESDKTARPQLSIYLRTANDFRYTTDDVDANQILITVGTGLSPFLAFLEHKQQLLKNPAIGRGGTTWLFLGAVDKAHVLRRDLLKAALTEGTLQEYFEAFSRPTDGRESTYVSAALEQQAVPLVELLLKPQTKLYVCADGSKISKAIEDSVAKCLRSALNMSKEEAESTIKAYRTEGKYCEETWV